MCLFSLYGGGGKSVEFVEAVRGGCWLADGMGARIFFFSFFFWRRLSGGRGCDNDSVIVSRLHRCGAASAASPAAAQLTV